MQFLLLFAQLLNYAILTDAFYKVFSISESLFTFFAPLTYAHHYQSDEDNKIKPLNIEKA